MFKIGSQRLTWMAVKWTGLADDGTEVQNEIEMQVQLVDRKDLAVQLENDGSAVQKNDDFARQVSRDWRGVADADGASLPYSIDNLALIWEAPGFAYAWGVAYLSAWGGVSGIRAKNSPNSRAAGQAGESKDAPAAKA